MTATDTFAHLALSAIAPSLTNPRKTFDAAKLQELADSIKASGVHQPVLVRPLPGARVADTGRGVTHELVSGERRLRASTIAGARTIPAMVRELTDDQVLEIQIVENLQRDDLTALEEAEGYQHLMHHTGQSADQVAAKIGKSRSYVYGRLKLLDLAPEPRQALINGALDASRALLIARIPASKLQAEATQRITQADYTGDTMSAREAAAYIQREYMLRLADAPFKRGDTTLLPTAGACTTCPKRTGANPDLFADVKGADVCTDPPCFRAKEQAHADATLKTARESGAELIEGREAKRLMPSQWSTRVEGYLRLDDASDSPTSQPLRKLIGPQMQAANIQPVLVANPHKPGQIIAVLPAEQVTPLLHAAGQAQAASKVDRDANADAKHAEHQAKQKAEDALEQGWRHQVLQAVIDATAKADKLTDMDPLLRYCALHFVGQLRADECKALAKHLLLGKVAPREGLEQWVQDHAHAAGALAILVAARDAAWQRWATENGRDTNTGLTLAAAALHVDMADIERRARSDARAAAMAQRKASAAKHAETAPPEGPAAQAEGGRGGKASTRPKKPPKAPAAPPLSETHAREQIAAALAAADAGADPGAIAQSDAAHPVLRPAAPAPTAHAAPALAVGQQVRVLASANGHGAKRWHGKTGQVVAQFGPEAWDIKAPFGRKGATYDEQRCFHLSELEIV